MIKPQMIENQKDFQCQNKHGQPIQLVVLDQKLDKKQRLLCTQCMEDFESDSKTIGFKKIIQIIEDFFEKKMNRLEIITSEVIQQLKMSITTTQELKTQFMKLFDSIISIAEDWTQNLMAQRQSYNQYSFFDELDIYIKNSRYDTKMQLFNNINSSWMTKLCNKLHSYNQDKDKVNFKVLRQKFIDISYSNLSQECEIKLKLIDQSVKQNGTCFAIVFDSSGSIMVSVEYKDIKVWRFLNRTIKLIKTFQGHTNQISCLVYSTKQNSFISGAADKTIRCWQQLDETQWISSQPYEQHTDYVMCIILNSNEDLLFSGSVDKSIKVWKVDLNQNKLTYMYSLEKHISQVTALSLNQSENLLISCAKGQDQIIIWERRESDKFEIKYLVIIDEIYNIEDQGKQVKFIKDNQFIWITGGKEIDKLYVFELKEGVFQENQEKTIQLIKNNSINDAYYFPIIYNNEKNLIILRHKTYICIIREMNDGKYKIVHQFNCDTYDIYGTITNNAQYLVYWDNKNKGYQICELSNK